MPSRHRCGGSGTAASACPSLLPWRERLVEMNFVTIRARIAEDRGDDRRRAERLPVALEVHMRELGTNGVEAKVVNISERGFMAIAEGKFEVGSRVWLMLPGRTRANAIVKWTAGDKIGAEFAEALSLDGLVG